MKVLITFPEGKGVEVRELPSLPRVNDRLILAGGIVVFVTERDEDNCSIVVATAVVAIEVKIVLPSNKGIEFQDLRSLPSVGDRLTLKGGTKVKVIDRNVSTNSVFVATDTVEATPTQIQKAATRLAKLKIDEENE